MAENRYLDKFTEDLKESGFYMDDLMKQKILRKTRKKMSYRRSIKIYAAAVCVAIVIISSFVPNTPVYALRQNLFSHIPGIGVVENTDESAMVRSVLDKPVRAEDGEEFIEIRTAYIRGEALTITAKTNIGAINAGEFEDPAEFKRFFSGETAPAIYLVSGDDKLKAGHTVWGGPSPESRVYSIEASFWVIPETVDGTFRFEVEGFGKPVDIAMSPVKYGADPSEMGNAAVVDNVIVFADISREGDIVEALISAVAPNDLRNIRAYLFDDEKEIFSKEVYIVDKDGTEYYPDEGLRKERDSGINTFFFRIPRDKEGMKLVIPQILYAKQYNGSDIKLVMPEPGGETPIDKSVALGDTTILLEKASVIFAGNFLLTEEFRGSDCLRIDISAQSQGSSREKVMRVIPNIQVPDSLFGYKPVSQSVYAEFWAAPAQSGYSIITFDGLTNTRKVLLDFHAEFSMVGPWEIDIETEIE